MIAGWIIFGIVVAVMLALDLGVFNKKPHVISFKESLQWSCLWLILSFSFGLGIYFVLGSDPAIEFTTAYLIEKSLSLDNVFVFLLIFQYFKVEVRYQHKILFWGVLGALIMRALMIGFGLTLITQFHWVIYLFGLILIYSAVKMLTINDFSSQLAENKLLKWLQTKLPFTPDPHGAKFWIKSKGRYLFTNLFLVLLTVEFADLIFAIDSIPAVLAISQDPFIIYTSNIFAILGLRAMYFLLADIVPRFVYIHHGLATILGFVGTKMLISHYYKIPTLWSLAIIGLILALSILLSILKDQRTK